MINDLQEYSHKRYNILTGEWVLVSPHRAKRPWNGKNEQIENIDRTTYDPDCYLCPGNERANGIRNPNYDSVFVFKNDFAAIQEDVRPFSVEDGLLQAKSEFGICKVVCFSPDHSKSLAEMSIENIKKVIATWQDEYMLLGGHEQINYVQIFENRGVIMGCSNPHPHGQIWSQSSIPDEVIKKDASQLAYFNKTGNSLLYDYLIQELQNQERIIFENSSFVILVPFWAVWPFETMILPKRTQKNISDMTKTEKEMFAEAISVLTKTYNKIFDSDFPYSSGIHQSPTDQKDYSHWHWHMSFYPPLLRSATIKKFMVGYEMFAFPQRDITPEAAANTIRKLI